MDFLFTINDAYVNPVEPLLFSIYDNLGKGNKYYFIYDDLSDNNIIKLTSFISEKCFGTAEFVRFPYNEVISELPLTGNWSKEVYFRLFAPYIFIDLDQIVYLDGDTIVTGKLEEIKKLQNDNTFVIAAVENDVQKDNLRRLGLSDQDIYINAGVLVINLQQWREKCTYEKMLQYLLQWKDIMKFQDQDFINLLWQKQFKILPRSYNYMISLTERDPSYTVIPNPEICHYVFTKPWVDYFEYGTDGPYIYYLRKSGKKKEALELKKKHTILRLKNKMKKYIKKIM